MSQLNDFLISPVLPYTLLSKGLILFTFFLLLIRFLPDFPRNLILLLVSLALIDIATSPFYVFLFIVMVGMVYYALLWIQWSRWKKEICYAMAGLLVVLFFLFMDLPAFRSPWTGSMVHRFGIAYSLFRILSVILDVGRGEPLPVEPLEYFLFCFFIPTFSQGPIERLGEFRQNLEGRPSLTWSETGSNLIRIAGAFLKGWVVLRFLSFDWKAYFDYPQQFSYGFLVWGMYVRAISFYLFVSAANDLTIACSAIAGYHLHENYDYPYFKRNLAGFWRSWHMTLVRFLRDYIYIPLGGNRRRIYFNYFLVFMSIALWHVTSAAFVIWGLWHWSGMCFLKGWQNFWKKIEEKESGFLRGSQLWARRHPRWTFLVGVLVTFHFVALSWMPFWGGHPQGLSMILRLISGNHWKLFVWPVGSF
jgi:D-alanyl-lipoteichoic acid acyltransferase DltB (MBOAT superfamily)